MRWNEAQLVSCPALEKRGSVTDAPVDCRTATIQQRRQVDPFDRFGPL